MSPWWPCGGCGNECFLPCDCFVRNCELQLDIAGWLDNASTDCEGIADLTFNGTHRVTSLNVTSSSPYGFECDFTLTFDALVLTKEVGGNCVCKTQSALYEIEGVLGCVDEGGGTFGLRLTLYFRVPVYDEDAGCAPSPCTVEPDYEIWTWDYFIATNVPGGSPICNLGSNPFGPATINGAAPTAQTTCGLGLDGTDATVSVSWVLCDPDDTTSGTTPCLCCDEDTIGELPDEMQVVLSGYANEAPCTNCAAIDGTYVLERQSGACFWRGCFDVEPCVTETPIDKVIMELWSSNVTSWWPGAVKTPVCAFTLIIYGNTVGSCAPEGTGGINHYLLGVFHDNAAHYEASGRCSTVSSLALDSIPPTYDDVDDWWRPGGSSSNVPGFYCDFQAVTATVSAI